MLGLAHGYVATCIINISTNDDKVYLAISVDNGKVRAARRPTPFAFDTAGTMKVSGKNEYLGLDNSGKLVVTSEPQGKFERKEKPDYTIGLNSTCSGARKASISIENVPVFG
ncbi:hypothetical protein OXX80_001466 [Metschnikowia pulcherrima]